MQRLQKAKANGQEIQEKFGVVKYRQDGKAICMGRTVMMYDTLNHMIRQGSLDTMEESETSMLWKAFPDVDLKQNDLLIFDRYYASHLTAVAVRPVNEALKRASVRVRYSHQVNFIEAIATMKKAVVSFFVTGKIAQAIKRVVRRLSDITEPIRPGRNFKRNHQSKRKHYMNYKPV